MILRNSLTTASILMLFLFFNSSSVNAQASNSKYNPALADSLGADEYGMKMYVLVLLKSGPTQISDHAKSDSLFNGHMKNIQRLVNEGKLVVAGPLEKNEKGYRGIFILNVKTIEEARALLQTDPTIKAKVLDAELYNWYGSAALSMYLPASEQERKKSF